MTKNDMNVGDEVIIKPEMISLIIEEVFETGFFGIDKDGESKEYSYSRVLAVFPQSYKRMHGWV